MLYFESENELKFYNLEARTLVKSAYQKVIFSYFSTKTYVVVAQKNRLNETVLLSTHKYVKTDE